MRYLLASQLYWLVWIASGLTPIGVALGVVVTAAAMTILWRIQWGTWLLGR